MQKINIQFTEMGHILTEGFPRLFTSTKRDGLGTIFDGACLAVESKRPSLAEESLKIILGTQIATMNQIIMLQGLANPLLVNFLQYFVSSN